MTLEETDDPTPETKTREKFRAWRTRPASVTNGRLLASRVVWTLFLAFSAYVGYRQITLDNEVTQDKLDQVAQRAADVCGQTNDRRAEAKEVAEGDVEQDQAALDSDQATWNAIDKLFPGGIPEPARTTIFTGLQTRQQAIIAQTELIDTVYNPSPCPSGVGEVSTD